MIDRKYTKEGLPIVKQEILKRFVEYRMKNPERMPDKFQEWFEEIINENSVVARYILGVSEEKSERPSELISYEGMIGLYKILKNQAKICKSDKD